MSASLEAKKLLVEEIKSKIQRAKSLTFVDYRGLTVEEDTKCVQHLEMQAQITRFIKTVFFFVLLKNVASQV